MGRYVVRDKEKYHVFSTVVMDAITVDMDSTEMFFWLQTFDGLEHSPNQAKRAVLDALEIGSKDWVYHTGGAYRPQPGVEPVIYKVRIKE